MKVIGKRVHLVKLRKHPFKIFAKKQKQLNEYGTSSKLGPRST